MARHFSRVTLAAALVFAAACGRDREPGADTRTSGQPAAKPAEEGDPVAAALAARLATDQLPAGLAADPAANDLWKEVRRLYEEAGHRPIWIEDHEARPAVADLRRAVAEVAADGLNPAHYELPGDDAFPRKSWNPLRNDDEADAAALADLDLRVSVVAVKLASHLVRGRVKPGAVDKHWFGQQRPDDVVRALRAGLDADELDKAFRVLRPRHAQYEGLKRALAEHRRIAAAGGWPTVPPEAAVKVGQSDPAVAVLRARLQASGDLSGAADVNVFDAGVQEALKKFQHRHGIAATGRLDRETRAALNVPVEARIRQIEINMERWRWLPETLGEEYILVNIPTFHLTAVEHGKVGLEMAVVTGTRDETPTPIFSDDMTTVVFSPYWNVPPNILREETIPAAMNNPGFIARQNMEVLVGDRVVDPWSVDWRNPRLRVRQRPGASNALGHVKFIFPNNFDVYLHDTPADALFARTDRDYSHGCVRVQKPFELAQWVLRDQPQWTPERIQSAMHSGQEKHVALRHKIPVYIVYATVWADDDGTVQFRDDLYGHDARQDGVVPASPSPTVLAATGAPAKGVS
jgi:murein L,D-transpeptidase YcbB/YkuD